MTVSSGFFNSKNHDRLYDAEQISSIFDGVILDGVYESIGDAFMVTPYSGANDTILVGTGRAWFNHTWTLNDSQFSFTLSPPNTLLGRIDAIVIDVDRRDSVRANSIVLVEGEYSTAPVKPMLIKEELHNQYPIAYITIPIGTSAPVSQSNIQYMVGTEECPLVTGPLEALNISNYLAQMESEFNVWFDGIKDILNENVVGELQSQIDGLGQEVDDLKNSSIDPDALDAVSNISVKKSTVNIMPNATHVLLPNGQLFVVGVYGSDDFNKILDDAELQSLYYGIINSDGVYVAKAKLFDLESVSNLIVPSTGVETCYAIPTLIGTSDVNAYPFNIYVTCYDLVRDYDNAPDPNNNRVARFTEYLVKITVTDTNVVSYTRTSKNAWLYNYYSNILKDYSRIYSPYLPICLSDGSYVTCGLVVDADSFKYYTFVGSRISSNFVQVYFGEKTTKIRSQVPGFPLHLIKSSNYDDRFALTFSGDSKKENEVFSNDFTYLGVMVDGALEGHTPGTSQNYTNFESDLDKIESLSNIYTIGDDGKSIYSNNYTLGDGDIGTDIRPYIDVNRSLTAISSSDTYVKSIITYDNNLLIAGYASGIKVAFTEGSGFMLFSDPVATTAFSDVSKLNIFKYFPNRQYVSSDKKKYVLVIKGELTLRDNSDLPPIRMPMPFDGSSTTDIITIELEG